MASHPHAAGGHHAHALRAALTVLAVVVFAPGPGGAQQAPTLLSTEATLADYGIADVGTVLRGRVSVAHTPDGVRLGIYFLRDTPPRRLGARGAETGSPAPAASPPEASGGGAAPGDLPRALWVWNTRALLEDSTARQDLVAFVGEHGFRRVFLQLAPAEGEHPRAGFVPFDAEATGALVGALRGAGAEVDALDGDPDYALEGNHAGVLATVARVAEANRTLPAQERFHGVHYDVEPYLVRGYQGPKRQEILDGYVALVAEVSRVAHQAGLSAGFAVPFWLDTPDEETGEVPMATLADRRAPVLDHVVATADEVAVMDYRTFARGEDGSVHHALGELTAAEKGRARVWVAVETAPLVDEDLYTFSAAPHDGFPEGPGGVWIVQEPLEEGRVRIWIIGNEPGRKELARRLEGRTALRWWPAGRPVRVAADKQSFHDLGAAKMRAEADTLARSLQGSPAFAGLAYHDYVNLRKLLAGGGWGAAPP